MADKEIIACAYCGRSSPLEAIHCLECGTELPLRETAAEAVPLPAIPAPQLVDASALEGCLSFEEGFHRADWKAIGSWIDSNVEPEKLNAAWEEAVLLWLCKLRDDLGGDYFAVQYPHVLLLCNQDCSTVGWMLDYIERAAVAIMERLPGVAWQGRRTKQVVFVIDEQDDYYQYLAYHVREGEQPASGGVCIHSGVTHFVIPWRDQNDAANAVLHELSHDCVAHLSLPLWLNEGVAVTLQRGVAPVQRSLGQTEQDSLFTSAINWQPPVMWDELADRHLQFWTEQNIQSFWAGTSFSEPGDSHELSYSLAEVFLRLLTEQSDPVSFQTFLQHARQENAGQDAALSVLGQDLGEISGTFLGPGNWRPQRKAILGCWEKAGWRSS